MGSNRGGEIGQSIDTLTITGFGDRQQSGRRQLPLGAAIAKTDFPRLHRGAECPFGAVVGRFNAFLIEEGKQPLVVFEKSGGEIADLAVGTVRCRSAKAKIRF